MGGYKNKCFTDFNLCFTGKTQTVTALGLRHKLFRFLLLQTIERPDYSVEKIIAAFWQLITAILLAGEKAETYFCVLL